SLLLPAFCFAGIAVWNNCAQLAGCAACHAADKNDNRSGKKADNSPFVPPPLSELDAKAGWTDQPVKDTLQMLRDKQAAEKPLVSVAQALALKNKTRQDNEKIASALGRVATNDSQVDDEATINRHIRRDIKSTNPIMYNTVEEGDVGGLTGFGLFGF